MVMNDPLCDRVVVVAHSWGTWGTVIAFEGLTNLLADLSTVWFERPKLLTVICLPIAKVYGLGT